MATFLSVPSKSSDEVSLINPLTKYIENTFEGLNKEEWSVAVSEFNKLRSQVLTKMNDRHESALDVLFRYHDQLSVVETKLPITENQIRVNFTWYDAIDKGNIFGKKKLSMSSSSFEKMAILFQIAAVQSQLGEDQNITSDDGLKSGAKYFQSASGIFKHLMEITSTYVNDPTPDLSRDTLSTLSALMVAQAQDCFCRKARRDKMKDGTIAKIASYAASLYQEAVRAASMTSIKSYWPKEWIPFMNCRHQAYLALAQYYQAMDVGNNKKFGEQVARLKKAQALMAESKKSLPSNITFPFSKEEVFIKEELTKAEKDNKLIYHDKEPSPSELAAVGQAPIAKPMQPSEKLSPKLKDLFAGIVPLAVHNAMNMFDSQKASICNQEIGRMREATQLMNGVLSSLNLPASIEDLTGQSLPNSVIEKSQKLRDMGGGNSVQKLISDLPELLSRNKEILDECTRLLDDEQNSDQQLRQQFGVRWTRKPSEELTQPIRAEGNKYQSILDAAVESDKVVKEKYGKLSTGIGLLSKSPADLQSSLPSGSSAASMKDSPAVRSLREMMAEVEKLKVDREELEGSLKEQQFDMAGKFLGAMASEGVVGEDSICEEELHKVYGPLRAEVNASLNRQEEVLASIQQANTEFCEARQSDQSSFERERLLKEMAEAFDGYMELKANLEEGTKFYNDLTQLLVKFQSKIRDFCFARKTEKDDLMKDVQQAIANKPTEGTVPKPATPARPPPPQVHPSTAPQIPPPGAPVYSQPPQAAPGIPSYGQVPPYPYPQYVPQQMPQGYNPYAAYGQAPMPYAQPYVPGAPQQYGPPGGAYGYGGPPPQYGYPQQQQYNPAGVGRPPYPAQQQWR